MTKDLTRRDFLATVGSGCAAGAALTGLAACQSVVVDLDAEPNGGNGGGGSGIKIAGDVVTLDLTKTDTQSLSAEGGFLLIEDATTFVINSAGSIKAFTSVCTHQACNVDNFASSQIRCPCHGSRYDTEGRVVQGPARTSLTEFQVERIGDAVTITK